METPFNMIIVGMTGCGKTSYLLKMLENKYMKHFEFIILICPTLSWNKTYQEWKYMGDEDLIKIECDHDRVDEFLHLVLWYTGERTL